MEQPLNSIYIGPDESKLRFGVYAPHYQLCRKDNTPIVGGIIPARIYKTPSSLPGIHAGDQELDSENYSWQRVESRRQRKIKRTLRELRAEDE
jgi:hypothetical protein